jgi:hypothetical protein
VLLFDVHYVRLFNSWTLRIYTAILVKKSIVLCLDRKEMDATAIHQNLFTTLGFDAVSYPMVTRILRERLFTHEGVPAQKRVVDLRLPLLN